MSRGNGHQLTQLDIVKGSRQSKLNRRAELRLEKKKLEAQIEAKRLEVVKALISQPPISGGLMFFVALALEKATVSVPNLAPGASSGTPGPNPIQQLLNGIGVTLKLGASGNLPGLEKNLTTDLSAGLNIATKGLAQLIGNADLAAFKAVCLIYIASGGNLVGILQSGGNALSSLLSSLGLAEVAK